MDCYRTPELVVHFARRIALIHTEFLPWPKDHPDSSWRGKLLLSLQGWQPKHEYTGKSRVQGSEQAPQCTVPHEHILPELT